MALDLGGLPTLNNRFRLAAHAVKTVDSNATNILTTVMTVPFKKLWTVSDCIVQCNFDVYRGLNEAGNQQLFIYIDGVSYGGLTISANAQYSTSAPFCTVAYDLSVGWHTLTLRGMTTSGAGQLTVNANSRITVMEIERASGKSPLISVS